MNKEKIINLFYDNHLKVKDISMILNIDKSYISRIIKKDERYLNEKESRKQVSKIRHLETTKRIVKRNRESLKFKNSVDDLILKNMHKQASMELSKGKYLSDESYRKWNCSAYKYNPSKKRYEFREELGRSYDVPKYIKERN
ncbi:MAG: hypothetical protein IJW20_07425 [Clostridia bacterium]|nr:hypothetical protein [Clostridia bacterium]